MFRRSSKSIATTSNSRIVSDRGSGSFHTVTVWIGPVDGSFVVPVHENSYIPVNSLANLVQVVDRSLFPGDYSRPGRWVELIFLETLFHVRLGHYRAGSVVEAGQLLALSYLALHSNKNSVNAQDLSGWSSFHHPKSICGHVGLPAVLSQGLGSCSELLEWGVSPLQLKKMYIYSVHAWCSRVCFAEFFVCNQLHISGVNLSSTRNSAFTFDDASSVPSRHHSSVGANTSAYLSPSQRSEQRQQHRKQRRHDVSVCPVTWLAVNTEGLHILYGQDDHEEVEKEPSLMTCTFQEMTRWSCSPDGHVLAVCLSSSKVLHLSGFVNGWGKTIVRLLSLQQRVVSLRPGDQRLAMLYDTLRIPPISDLHNPSVLDSFCKVSMPSPQQELAAPLQKRQLQHLVNTNTTVDKTTSPATPASENSVVSLTSSPRDIDSVKADHKEHQHNSNGKIFLLLDNFASKLLHNRLKAKCFHSWSRYTVDRNQCKLRLSILQRQRVRVLKKVCFSKLAVNSVRSLRLRALYFIWKQNNCTRRLQASFSKLHTYTEACRQRERFAKRSLLNSKCRYYWRRWANGTQRNTKLRCNTLMSWSVRSHELTQRRNECFKLWKTFCAQEITRRTGLEAVFRKQKLLRHFKNWKLQVLLTTKERENHCVVRWAALAFNIRMKVFQSKRQSFQLMLVNYKVEQKLKDYRDTNSILLQLVQLCQRRYHQVVSISFHLWRNATLFDRSLQFYKHIDRIFLRKCRAGFHKWRARTKWKTRCFQVLSRLDDIFDFRRLQRMLHQSWMKLCRHTINSSRRFQMFTGKINSFRKRLVFNKLYSASLKSRRLVGAFNLSEIFGAGTLRHAWNRWTSVHRTRRIIEGMISSCSVTLLRSAFDLWKEYQALDNCVVLSDVVDRIQRRILLQRGLNSWKRYVIVSLLHQSTAVATLCDIFETYSLKRVHEAFSRWKSFQAASKTESFVDYITCIIARIDLQHGFNLWKRFVLVKGLEQDYAIQRLTEVFQSCVEANHVYGLSNAFRTWKEHTQISQVCSLVEVIDAIHVRILTRRALANWKRFMVIRTAEETWGLSLITKIFEEYLSRNDKDSLVEAFARWKSFLFSSNLCTLRNVTERIHACMQQRRALKLWKQFVLKVEMEQSYAIVKLEEIFGRYDKVERSRRAFHAWKKMSCQKLALMNVSTIVSSAMEKELADRLGETFSIPGDRSPTKMAFVHWQKTVLHDVDVRSKSALALAHLLSHAFLRVTFSKWHHNMQILQQEDLRSKLLQCQESIYSLQQACRADLQAAQKLHSLQFN